MTDLPPLRAVVALRDTPHQLLDESGADAFGATHGFVVNRSGLLR
jgi:hypothetical protein